MSSHVESHIVNPKVILHQTRLHLQKGVKSSKGTQQSYSYKDVHVPQHVIQG